MHHRLILTGSELPKPKRGVTVATFTTEEGYRWLWSVDSRGVLVGLKTVPPGADFLPIVDALWAELDRVDPMPASVSSERPALELIA